MLASEMLRQINAEALGSCSVTAYVLSVKWRQLYVRIQGSSRLRAGFGSGNYQHLAVLTSAEILRKTQGPLSLAASPGIQIAPDAQALGFPSCFF